MTPLLHDYWRSSASYRVRIALNLKGIAYDARQVDILSQAHKSPEHLAIHPQGLLPVLEMDGLRLTQSVAIIEYLDETRPEPRLLPAGPADRARVRAIAFAIAMEIHPVCNRSVALHASGGDEAAFRAWMQHYIPAGLAAVETLLDHPSTGRFCHGDAPGLADCCLVPQLYNARRFDIDPAQWPRIAAVEAACADLPAFAAALPETIGPPPPRSPA